MLLLPGCLLPRGECVRGAVRGYPSISTVPNGIDLARYAGDFGPLQADTLVYAGSLTYQPNFDAVSFFVREIFPRIRAKRPNARLLVTGSLDGVDRASLPDTAGVEFTGYVDDVRPTIARSWLSIAPLRAGGGTRVKILESLALGTPVVATRKGAEGLDLMPGRDLLVADDPAEFAAAVVRVLDDEALRNTLGCQGGQAVAAKYGWDTIGQQFLDRIDGMFVQSRALA